MTIQDPIADMLTRIRNAQAVKRSTVRVHTSRLAGAILAVLCDEGYIESFEKIEGLDVGARFPIFEVRLKYHEGQPVIQRLVRVSKPGLRVYKSRSDLPRILGGLGVAIVSNPKGVMSDRKARKIGQGGEVLCWVA